MSTFTITNGILKMEPIKLSECTFAPSAGSVNPKTGERKAPKLALSQMHKGGYQLVGVWNDAPVKVAMSLAVPVESAT